MGNRGGLKFAKPPDTDEQASQIWAAKGELQEGDNVVVEGRVRNYSQVLWPPSVQQANTDARHMFFDDWEAYGLDTPFRAGSRYRKVLQGGRIISTGAFGAVYDVKTKPSLPSRNYHGGEDRYVVKIVDKYKFYQKTSYPVPTPDQKKKFILNLRKEVWITWKLPHDQPLGQLLRYYEDKQFVYMILEKYGPSLRHLLRTASAEVTPANIKSWMTCVFQGLAWLGEQGKGVGHFDLKPANVCTRRAAVNQAVIIDFGLAKEGPVKKAGGTDAYMAPEVLEQKVEHDKKVDNQADMWSAGVMMWEMLDTHPFQNDECDAKEYEADGEAAGRFQRDADARAAIAAAEGEDEPPPPPTVSESAQEVIIACVALNLKKRQKPNEVLGLPYFTGRPRAAYSDNDKDLFGSDEEEWDVFEDEEHPLAGTPVYADHVRLLRENRRLKSQLRNIARLVRRAEDLLLA